MPYPRGAHRLSGGRSYRRVAATQQNDATGTGTGSSGGGGGASAPANSVAPAVTGTATVGQTLSTTDGTWTGTPTSYTYQWQRDGVNIGGATANTYLLVTADGGTSVRCVVTATNGAGNASANSNAISVAAAPTYAATVLADSPVRYWKFNEASGTTATDSSTSAADANYFSGPSLGSTAGPMTGETAVTFTRASNHLIYDDGNATMLNGGGIDIFSLEIWLKRSATQGVAMGIHSWNGTAGTYYLTLLADNTIALIIVGSGSCVSSSAALTDTASWHHIVATHSAATGKLYVDGSDVSTGSADFEQYATETRICVGSKGNTIEVFDGSLAHAAIYNTVLSAARVSAHYAARA